MPNPWMSLWLSAANSWAGAMRGFWTAEMRRQQTAMANEMVRQQTAMTNEMVRQTIDFWTKTWMAPIADHKPKRRR